VNGHPGPKWPVRTAFRFQAGEVFCIRNGRVRLQARIGYIEGSSHGARLAVLGKEYGDLRSPSPTLLVAP
jgi:hypothetical protein